MAVRSGLGFTVARVADHAELFSESPSRVVLCVAPDLVPNVVSACEHLGVPSARIGEVGGRRLVVKDLLDVALDDALLAWRDRLPEALGAGTTQG
jgi:phosphoribosylformylglycinamidine (FGAM) synthase-like enzyme